MKETGNEQIFAAGQRNTDSAGRLSFRVRNTDKYAEEKVRLADFHESAKRTFSYKLCLTLFLRGASD